MPTLATIQKVNVGQMCDTEICWTMVSAIGQVAGAIATFLAVIVSLWIAFHGRKPRLTLSVGERIVMGGVAPDVRLLVFDVANMGERPVHVRGLGWRTGWVRWGPSFLRYQYALQIVDPGPYGTPPPYELQPGDAASSMVLLEHVLAASTTRAGPPFFSRDLPILGRKGTKITGYAYTANGYMIRAKAEKALRKTLIKSEIDALAPARDAQSG